MRTAQPGDQVLVRYTRRLEGGAPTFRPPGRLLELTVGRDHPRLRGLGLALVGLAPAGRVSVTVPPEQGYGPYDPTRTYRLSRARFAGNPLPEPGRWLRMTDGRGRRRLVRVLRVGNRAVLVDNNHPLAGRSLHVEVELLEIRPAAAPCREASSGPGRLRAMAFDVDEASLDCLREALPEWEVAAVRGATAASLVRTWDPARVDLLVVALDERVTEGLALCRFLAFCSPYSGDARQEESTPVTKADAPLLVLIPPGHEPGCERL